MTQRQKVLAGVQTAIGTEQTALSTMMVENVSTLAHQVAAPERREAKGAFGFTAGPKPRPSFTTCTITGGIIPSSTLGGPPTISPLLQACGLSEVATPATDVVYTPVSSGHKAVTLKIQEDGQTHKLVDAMGNLQISWEVGDTLKFQAAMTGHYNAPVAEAISTLAVGRTPFPVIASEASVSNVDVFGFTAARIQSFNLDLGNRIFARDLAGGRLVRITDRGVSGTIVIEAPTLAENDFFFRLTNGSTGPLTWKISDNGANPDVLFESLNEAMLTDIQHQDVDGIRFYALAFRLVANTAGDGEFIMTLA